MGKGGRRVLMRSPYFCRHVPETRERSVRSGNPMSVQGCRHAAMVRKKGGEVYKRSEMHQVRQVRASSRQREGRRLRKASQEMAITAVRCRGCAAPGARQLEQARCVCAGNW